MNTPPTKPETKVAAAGNGNGPLTADQISSLLAKATTSMQTASQELLEVGSQVAKLGQHINGEVVKLVAAIEGNMTQMEGRVRSFCELSIQAGRKAEEWRDLLEKSHTQS